MPLFLTIDIGNSSAKAAVWSGDRMAKPSVWGALTAASLEALCDGRRPDAACVCAVAADPCGLAEAAKALAGGNLLEVNAFMPLPVDLSAYLTPASLGADRIAAMAGAISLAPGRELLVADVGTAATFDRVSASGRFLGGNISPGLGMRLRAMHAFTARLPLVAADADAPQWGLCTEQAMQAGALAGVLAELDYYRRLAGPDATMVLTGGRTSELKLPFEHIADPDLVLRGLKYIIDYNESH